MRVLKAAVKKRHSIEEWKSLKKDYAMIAYSDLEMDSEMK